MPGRTVAALLAAAVLGGCSLRGGEGTIASTKGEFDDALSHAQKSDRIHVIELKIARNDVSQQLARIAAEVRKMRGSKLQETRRIKPRTPARSV